MNIAKIYPIKSPRIASRIIDGEAVVVIPEESQVNILNRTGSRIWELSDGEKNLEEIAVIISNEFEISLKKAYQDAREFVEDLMKREMVILSDKCNTN